jgi:murein DD-endopeptidase MepM/ murein hydrolase activator NlpD
MTYLRSNQQTFFAPIPDAPAISFSWPTNNRKLFTSPGEYFARTRVNAQYGRPGWTRDCGKRFHRGCDIAPVSQTSEGKTHTVMFSDCATGQEFPGNEPGWIPNDDIFAVTAGRCVEIQSDPSVSTLGLFAILEHSWPDSDLKFYSLYAHLQSVSVILQQAVSAGALIGTMGQTSSSADAREWMAIAPHLHLEFWNEAGESYDPEMMLRRFIRD